MAFYEEPESGVIVGGISFVTAGGLVEGFIVEMAGKGLAFVFQGFDPPGDLVQIRIVLSGEFGREVTIPPEQREAEGGE